MNRKAYERCCWKIEHPLKLLSVMNELRNKYFIFKCVTTREKSHNATATFCSKFLLSSLKMQLLKVEGDSVSLVNFSLNIKL